MLDSHHDPSFILNIEYQTATKKLAPYQLYWSTNILVASYKLYGDPDGIRTRECCLERAVS